MNSKKRRVQWWSAIMGSIFVHLGVLVAGIYLFPPAPIPTEREKALEFVQVSAFVSAPPPAPARKASAPQEALPPPQPSEAAMVKVQDTTNPEPEPEPDPELKPDQEPEPEPAIQPEVEQKGEESSQEEAKSEASTEHQDTSNNTMPVPERIFLPSIRVDTLPTYRIKAELEYPPAARRQNREGRVIIEADIDESGTIVATRVLQRAGFGFDESALIMIRSSEFNPALVRGKPVAVRMRFTLDFKLKSTGN